MLKNRGYSFYTQWLGSVMQVFALVLAVGFASSALATKKPCREGANFTPHCHIGDHAEETTDDWDVIYLWDITVELNFSDGDSTTSATLYEEVESTHEEIVGKSLDDLYVEVLCRDYGDFGSRDEADVTFSKIETLFIDVHHHDHDGSILDPLDPDDHQHALIATCTEGGGNGGGNGGGKGRKNR